ncbi:hypothetical protein ABVK25_010416 [Lepraria finkii]|uniref:Beta-lactamase-related domain-containing protein n=1 Tax=Lepraria finkii TaxID=1340010 RepID=A0ABR4AUF2_9LECA
MKYRKSRGERIVQPTTVSDWSSVPLLYEPGIKWLYGTALDWAGKLVERVTCETLEEYMKKNIWKPLGITDIMFWPSERKG